MAHPDDLLVLPRPSACSSPNRSPIKAPSEAAFTSVFGHLLPPATFLTTPTGNIAYYALPPTTSSTVNQPQRVLLIHGVQTPAIGLLPLATRLHRALPSAHFVLLELPGHGLSDTPIVPHTPSLFHSTITALLDHLSWPSAHLLGYSFGGVTSISYCALNSSRVQSLALVAPAGLYRSADLDQERLYSTDEWEAQTYVLSLLEGPGGLCVPLDWKERVARGEVVAEAVREWEMREHEGHAASVVAIFRDGGVLDSSEDFIKAAETGVGRCVVLGGDDDIATMEELAELGFSDVTVTDGAKHDVVRSRVEEVAEVIESFWNGIGLAEAG